MIKNIDDGKDIVVFIAEEVKKNTDIKIQTVGNITNPIQAEEIITSGKADMVTIARGFLDNPRWVWHAAEKLGVKIPYPQQYERVKPDTWSGYASK